VSRVEVAESQRHRLMLAMTNEVAERGYVATSVARVTTRAGVSRESFYQQFGSKLDCFLACFDAAADRLFGPLRGPQRGGGGAPGPPPWPLSDALRGASPRRRPAEPACAKVFLVEVYAAGPEAVRR